MSRIRKVSVFIVVVHRRVVGEDGSLLIDKVMIVVAIVLGFLGALRLALSATHQAVLFDITIDVAVVIIILVAIIESSTMTIRMITEFSMTLLPFLFSLTIQLLPISFIAEIVALEVIFEVSELFMTNGFVVLRLLSLLLVLLFLRFL